LTARGFWCIIENVMLTAEELHAIDQAAQQVARAGWGLVAIVIENGRVTRLQQQTDLRIEKRARPVQLTTNSEKS
jgi:hypothetical protein